MRATNSIFYRQWYPCTTRPEPILSETIENCKAAGNAHPTRKTPFPFPKISAGEISEMQRMFFLVGTLSL
jgi:hypothetical protein